MKQRGLRLTKPGWSKPHTHSKPTNLALFRHKITLYRFSQGAHTIAGGSNGSRRAEPPCPLTLATGCLWYDEHLHHHHHHLRYIADITQTVYKHIKELKTTRKLINYMPLNNCLIKKCLESALPSSRVGEVWVHVHNVFCYLRSLTNVSHFILSSLFTR